MSSYDELTVLNSCVARDAACLPAYAKDEIIGHDLDEPADDLALFLECTSTWMDVVFCAWPDPDERNRLFPRYNDDRRTFYRYLREQTNSPDTDVAKVAKEILDAPSWEQAKSAVDDALFSGELPDQGIVESNMGRYAIYRAFVDQPLPASLFFRLSDALTTAQITDIARIGATPGIRRAALQVRNGDKHEASFAPPVRLVGEESIADLVQAPHDAEDEGNDILSNSDVPISILTGWEDTWFPDNTENFDSAQHALEAILILSELPLPQDAEERICNLRNWFDAVWEKHPTYDEREAVFPGFHDAENKFELVLRDIIGGEDGFLADTALLAVRDPIALGRWLFYKWSFNPNLMMQCLWNMAKNPRLTGDKLSRLATDSANDEVRIALTTDNTYWDDCPRGDTQDALRYIGEYGCKQLVRERRDGFPWMSAIELIKDQDFLWDLYKGALNEQDTAKECNDATMPANKNDEIRESATMAITDQGHLFEIAMKDEIFLVRLLAVERLSERNLLLRLARESDDAVIRSSAEKLYNKLYGCSLPRQ